MLTFNDITQWSSFFYSCRFLRGLLLLGQPFRNNNRILVNFPDLLGTWALFNPPANNQIKAKGSLLEGASDIKSTPVLSGFSLLPFRWCVWRLESGEMERRTEKRCCHHTNPFILLYDWWLCECVKTHCLVMSGRRLRAQVSLYAMHRKHLCKGQKTRSVGQKKKKFHQKLFVFSAFLFSRSKMCLLCMFSVNEQEIDSLNWKL